MTLYDKFLELIFAGGKLASFSMSLLSIITNPEHASQFKLVKDPDSNRVTDLLINKTIPVFLYSILLTFG